jgi:DNA-binding NarL/FixJ family response regulator
MEMSYQQIKEDIYNYSIHKSICEELLEKNKINTKMAQTYSDMPKGKGNTYDGVCSEVFRRMVIEDRIKKLNNKMVYIDNAMYILDDFEKEVINYSKKGYKMTQIAVQLDCTRKKVENARNRAIDKILEYICRDERLSV